MRTKKSLGQHFLTNDLVAQKTVDAIRHPELVVEVGPGPGMLTKHLVERCERLILVEKDDTLAPALRERYRHLPHITVIHADFLRVDFSEIVGDATFSLVGNFPYNISSQIVFKMLEHRHQVIELVGMFQLEMAQRILAGPGSKTYSVIGVQTQTAYSGDLLMKIPPEDFDPPPKVWSAVIHLMRKDDFSIPCDPRVFRTVVRSAFSQRRKMLRNSLKLLLPPDVLQQDLFQKRPEHISLETFYHITRLAEAYRNAQNA